MKQRRFSAQQLFHLRNNIPIAGLIEHILQIPCKTRDGVFRFLCPQCNEFNTSIKTQTNLARCFRCETNFNTIDMVIAVKKTKFIEAADFLTECDSSSQLHKDTTGGHRQAPASERPSSTSTIPRNSLPPTSHAPVALGEILADLINTKDPEQSIQEQPSAQDKNSSLAGRMDNIELLIHQLSQQLAEIRNLLYNQK